MKGAKNQVVQGLNSGPSACLSSKNTFELCSSYIGKDNNKSKEGDKDQESIQSSTTPDPINHMGN